MHSYFPNAFYMLTPSFPSSFSHHKLCDENCVITDITEIRLRAKRLGFNSRQVPVTCFSFPSAGVKNTWSYTSIPPYAFMVWCLVKHRGKFIFTFTSLPLLEQLWDIPSLLPTGYLGFFSRGYSGQGVKLTTYLYIVLRPWMCLCSVVLDSAHAYLYLLQ
jgi:hypothetical protein